MHLVFHNMLGVYSAVFGEIKSSKVRANSIAMIDINQNVQYLFNTVNYIATSASYVYTLIPYDVAILT